MRRSLAQEAYISYFLTQIADIRPAASGMLHLLKEKQLPPQVIDSLTKMIKRVIKKHKSARLAKTYQHALHTSTNHQKEINSAENQLDTLLNTI